MTGDGAATALSWVADGASTRLRPQEITLPPLASDDVRIAVEHCSICMSDLDVIGDVFSNTAYPCVAGHEIIGRVVDAGPDVSELEVGDLAGVGPQRWSCGTCDFCSTGRENLCPEMVMTPAFGTRGGFTDLFQVSSRFAFKLPQALDVESSAPLMCAGLTVFSPLRRYTSGASRVGILGVGGLGHLAVQFAAAMDHHVTAFSNVVTESERARLHGLGASAVVDTTDAGALRAARASVDVLVSTVHGGVKFSPYVAALRPGGVLCLIGNTPGSLDASILRLIHFQQTIAGSAAGSRADMADMLEFAARSGVRPVVEHAPVSDINEQIERVRAGTPRYRVVLDLVSSA